MKIFITGGTGFLGSNLIESLLRDGHEITVASRQKISMLGPRPYQVVSWPLTSESEISAVQGCEAVFHLAGESIGHARWSQEQKEKILSSRVQSTRELIDILRGSTHLKVLISASGIGFYGDRKTETLKEDSPRGEGFLADVCVAWEGEALHLPNKGVRKVLLRTGVVLDRGQGFLGEMEPLYQKWVGGPVGSGEQMLSWIHIEDWVQAAKACLTDSRLQGPVNIVGPEPTSNRSFSILYGELFKQPFQIPAPGFALKVGLGEMAALALDSQKVQPAKLQSIGFQFRFQNLKDALWEIYTFEKNKRRVYDYFSTTTWLPAPIEKVFGFFGNENNLEKMTPAQLKFQVLKKSTAEIMKGTLIDYKLKVHGVPIKWRTLIAEWEPPYRFADQQIKGPYSHWYHVHTFETLAGGTLMKDQVHYKLPLSGLGRIFGGRFVKGDLNEIFTYRKRTLTEMYDVQK